MANTYTLEKFAGGMHYIMLSPKTVLALTKNNNKRIICTLNGMVTLHCAIMPKKEGGHFINIGLATCKKLSIKVGAIITATFVIDTTAYQFEMPEELQEVLNTDEEASNIFHALTEGNQRGLIYLVSQVKASNKKIERALKIAATLKLGISAPKLMLT